MGGFGGQFHSEVTFLPRCCCWRGFRSAPEGDIGSEVSVDARDTSTEVRRVRTGRVKLVLSRQSSKMAVWSSMASVRRRSLTVSVATSGSERRFHCFPALLSPSVCALSPPALLNPDPQAARPAPRRRSPSSSDTNRTGKRVIRREP